MKLRKRLAALTLAAVTAIAPTLAVNADDSALSELRYASVSGEIKSIEPFYTDDDTIDESRLRVLVVDADGNEVNFTVDESTYVKSDSELAEGTKVTGFYDGSAPVILIYPPQYPAEALIAADDVTSVKYSSFNAEGLSADGELKLNISDETEIILQDGTEFDGDIAGRRVLVFYSVTTRSIPPQTSPSLIVVLFEKAAPPVYELEPEQEFEIGFPLPVFENDDIFIKLRSAVEMYDFGLELTWVQAERKIYMGDNIVIEPGNATVTVNGVSVVLSAAPQIINGATYVPLDFFTTALAENVFQ